MCTWLPVWMTSWAISRWRQSGLLSWRHMAKNRIKTTAVFNDRLPVILWSYFDFIIILLFLFQALKKSISLKNRFSRIFTNECNTTASSMRDIFRQHSKRCMRLTTVVRCIRQDRHARMACASIQLCLSRWWKASLGKYSTETNELITNKINTQKHNEGQREQLLPGAAA